MKTTENKTIVALVERLSNVLEKKKALELEEKEMKDAIKDILKGFEVNILGAGEYVVVLSDRTRRDVDKQKVKELLGDKYSEVEKKTEYQTLEVKRA